MSLVLSYLYFNAYEITLKSLLEDILFYIEVSRSNYFPI